MPRGKKENRQRECFRSGGNKTYRTSCTDDKAAYHQSESSSDRRKVSRQACKKDNEKIRRSKGCCSDRRKIHRHYR